MRFASCFVLLVALEVTPTTSSSIAHLRRQRETPPSIDGFILNSTDVVEVQLNPGNTSLKFEVCHKPECKGTMFLWFSATGTNPDAKKHKDAFCYVDFVFLDSLKLLPFESCIKGTISDTQITFFRYDPTNNPCGLHVSDDRRLKLQLESLVEGCVTNGRIWTERDDGRNSKLGLAIGIPVGIIVIIGVVILLVIFVGRLWWKKRKTKKNQASATNASKNLAKRSSAAILPVKTSACTVIPASSLASPTPSASSAPLTPSALSASAAPPVSLTRPMPSASVTPAASSVPSEFTVNFNSKKVVYVE